MFFTIDTDNEIVAHETAPAAQDGTILFATEKEFTKATAEWPINRLVELWNGFAGVAGTFGDLKPVKKFENKTKATRRIWAAIQRLAVSAIDTKAVKEMVDGAIAKTAAAPAAPKPKAKTPKAAKPAGEAKAPREGTAKATVLAMIQRKGGATLDEIMKETGWQKHTVRGFMSVAPKKAGLDVTSSRRESDKARVYEVAR